MPDPEDNWHVWKPCRWDGRRLVMRKGHYMTYGGGVRYDQDGTTTHYETRGTMDIDVVPHP